MDNKLKLLAVLSIFHYLTLCQDHGRDSDKIKNIGNRIVEENEIQEIILSEYFYGQLLKYRLMLNVRNNTSLSTDIRDLVYLRQPYQLMNSQMVSNESYKYVRKKPFPRSSVISDEYRVPNNNGTTMALHFITRDLRFTIFNMSNYTDSGQIDSIFDFQLNQTLINAQCSDLIYDKRYSPLKESFYFFCQDQVIGPKSYQAQYSVIMVNKTQIRKNSSDPQIARMYSMGSQGLPQNFDFDGGFLPIHVPNSYVDQQSIYYKIFLCYTVYQAILDTEIIPPERIPVIIILNLKEFAKMEEEQIVWNEGDSILKLAQTFTFENVNYNVHIYDSIVLQNDIFSNLDHSIYFAFAVGYNGILICSYNSYHIGDPTKSNLSCDVEQSQVLYIKGSKIQGLYMSTMSDSISDRLEPYFYGITTRPPTVMEFEMSDIENVILNKVYQINNNNDGFLGTLNIAVNDNYIMHLLEDPDNQREVIRVYCRSSSYFSSAMFDIEINPLTKSDFFTFPNKMFNLVIIRDERSVNVSAIVDFALILRATNLTVLEIYKNQVVDVWLFTESIKNSIFQHFTVYFVDQYNTSIFVSGQSAILNKQADIFYNCGEIQLSYIVSDQLDGPNYNLYQDNNESSLGFFQIENQDLKLYNSVQFDFEHTCIISFIFPVLKTHKIVHGEKSSKKNVKEYNLPSILICIDTTQLKVSSYTVQTSIDGKPIIKTNEIILPELTFIDFAFDTEMRLIFALAEQPAYKINKEEAFVQGRYEIHVFQVQNEIIWQNMIIYKKAINITMFSYNHLINVFLIVEYQSKFNELSKRGDLQLIRIEYYNITSGLFDKSLLTVAINQSYDQRIVRAQIASEHCIITLTVDKRIVIYQVSQKIDKIREIYIEDITNFDVFDNKYFVLYRQNNVIDIYEIRMYIYLSYRRRLPFYKDYENFSFKLQSDIFTVFPNLVRSYKNDILSLLMTRNITDQNGSTQIESFVFVYGLKLNQHNSFILVKDMSQQFGQDPLYNTKANYSRIILTQDNEKGKSALSVLSNNQINLYNAQLYNKLILNENGKKSLIEKCKTIKLQYDKEGKPINETKIIETIKVRPETLFSSTDQSSSGIELTLRVRTVNQGFAISAKTKQDENITISFSNETKDTSVSQNLLHETYIEGQGAFVIAACVYHDENGKEKYCDRGTVVESRDIPYLFPIEFVTGERYVVRSFSMGKLFFMFDNFHQLTVHRLPIYQDKLDQIEGQALIKLYSGPESELFDCNITGFADYSLLKNYNSYVKNPVEGSETYLMFYHCSSNEMLGRRILKISLITVLPISSTYDQDSQSKMFYNDVFIVKTYQQHIIVPNDIISIEKTNVRFVLDKDGYYFDIFLILAISCLADYSYTNKLIVYDIQLDKDVFMLATELAAYTANCLFRDTYQITKMSQIPKSELIIAVLEDFGFQIMNLTQIFTDKNSRNDQIFISEVDLRITLEFSGQLYRERGSLIVHSITLNLPKILHVITNYGLFILEYAIDLTDLNQINTAVIDGNLKPNSQKWIKLQFTDISNDIAHNDYGSAFLVKRNMGINNFEMYLVATSYYSALNSIIFKTIPITQNENCIALQQNTYFEFTPEDQLAVSFICNQYLNIYRVCMRPHVEINLSRYIETATVQTSENKYYSGAFQYNEFMLYLVGFNSFISDDINVQNINVLVRYQEKSLDYQIFLISAAMSVLSLFVYLVFYAHQTRSEVKTLKNIQSVKNSIESSDQQIPTRTYSDISLTRPYSSNIGLLNRTMTSDTISNNMSRDISADLSSSMAYFEETEEDKLNNKKNNRISQTKYRYFKQPSNKNERSNKGSMISNELPFFKLPQFADQKDDSLIMRTQIQLMSEDASFVTEI